MTESFDFTEVDRFCAGALGEPGSRVFFLQVSADGALVSLKMEKQQVAALGEYLARILDDLAPTDEPVGEPPRWLHQECETAGIASSRFQAIQVGETFVQPVG